jgi:hypothetical protein
MNAPIFRFTAVLPRDWAAATLLGRSTFMIRVHATMNERRWIHECESAILSLERSLRSEAANNEESGK